MRLAIFDFDGTILTGNSWHEFYRFEIRRRPTRAPILVAGLALRLTRVWTGTRLRDLALRSLRGCTEVHVAEIGAELHRQKLAGMIRSEAREELHRCREEGFAIVIATGAFAFLVTPFARESAIEHVVASRVRFRDGICAGEREGPEALGSEKACRLSDYFKSQSIDWDTSRAYTDSILDAPLLSLTGTRNFIATDETVPKNLPNGTKVLRWSDSAT